MHSFLSEESAKSCFVGVGDALFRAQGMVFGLTVSPQKYVLSLQPHIYCLSDFSN